MVVVVQSTERDNALAGIAILAIRFITPLLLSVLAFIAIQANHTLGEVVDKIQQIQITMAADGAEKQEFRRVIAEVKTNVADHETRLRLLEKNK